MLEKLWMVLKLGAMSLVWMLATVMVAFILSQSHK